MNIYITGHGYMAENQVISAIQVRFYAKAGGDLTADDIPAIVDGTTGSIENQTVSEHYIYGTKVDTDIEEYLITDFDHEGGDFFIPDGKQQLKEYTNENGDINVFPITSDPTDNNILNVERIAKAEVGVGNKLSEIVGHYRNKYKGKPLTFHWLACRKLIYPELI